MIGCPLSSDRFNPGPEVVLWRWVVLVLGQVLACLAYWGAGPVGGGADVGDGCEQGVLPEVVDLPPGDLFEQVRVGSAAQRCRTRVAYWSFVFCRPRNVHSGRNRSRIPSSASGSARLAPHQSSASAARRRNTSPRKVLSRGCNWASSLSSSTTSAPRASPFSRIWRAVAASSRVGLFLAAIPRGWGRTPDRGGQKLAR
jgi:hypothetical protein